MKTEEQKETTVSVAQCPTCKGYVKLAVNDCLDTNTLKEFKSLEKKYNCKIKIISLEDARSHALCFTIKKCAENQPV